MTAADDAVAQQISELENRRYQALTDADLATLEELLSPDLVYTHSDASSDTRQSYLDKVASKALIYGVIDHPVSSIVVRGDSALVFHDMRGEVQVGGATRALNSRSLAVWVREDGAWRLLAYQPTRIPG
jgi:hypothetical protein